MLELSFDQTLHRYIKQRRVASSKVESGSKKLEQFARPYDACDRVDIKGNGFWYFPSLAVMKVICTIYADPEWREKIVATLKEVVRLREEGGIPLTEVVFVDRDSQTTVI